MSKKKLKKRIRKLEEKVEMLQSSEELLRVLNDELVYDLTECERREMETLRDPEEKECPVCLDSWNELKTKNPSWETIVKSHEYVSSNVGHIVAIANKIIVGLQSELEFIRKERSTTPV